MSKNLNEAELGSVGGGTIKNAGDGVTKIFGQKMFELTGTGKEGQEIKPVYAPATLEGKEMLRQTSIDAGIPIEYNTDAVDKTDELKKYV